MTAGGSGIEATSENDSAPPSGTRRGHDSKARTSPEDSKALFKDAAKAVTCRDPDAPEPEAKRKSRDEGDGSPVIRRPPSPALAMPAGLPAARGRYAVLQNKAHHADLEIPPEFLDEGPQWDWWQYQQMFMWDDWNNDGGFDFGGDEFGSTGPTNFPAPQP